VWVRFKVSKSYLANLMITTDQSNSISCTFYRSTELGYDAWVRQKVPIEKLVFRDDMEVYWALEQLFLKIVPGDQFKNPCSPNTPSEYYPWILRERVEKEYEYEGDTLKPRFQPHSAAKCVGEFFHLTHNHFDEMIQTLLTGGWILSETRFLSPSERERLTWYNLYSSEGLLVKLDNSQ